MRHEGKSHKDWFVFLYDELKKVSAKYPSWQKISGPGLPADEFADLHFATEQKLCEAIWQFSESGRWPDLAPSEGAILITRLDEALFVAEHMGFIGASIWQRRKIRADWDDAEWIRWFLLDYWENVGFELVHSKLEALLPAFERSFPNISPDEEGDQSGAT